MQEYVIKQVPIECRKESSIRRYQSYLTISGTAVIIFSVWSFFRYTLYLYTHPDLVFARMGQSLGDAVQDKEVLIIAGVMYVVLFGLIILLNVYIGRGAMKEGRGGKRGRLYLILSALYLIGCLISSVSAFAAEDVLSGGSSVGTGMIVDISTIFAHGNLLYSAFRLRSLTRKMN